MDKQWPVPAPWSIFERNAAATFYVPLRKVVLTSVQHLRRILKFEGKETKAQVAFLRFHWQSSSIYEAWTFLWIERYLLLLISKRGCNKLLKCVLITILVQRFYLKYIEKSLFHDYRRIFVVFVFTRYFSNLYGFIIFVVNVGYINFQDSLQNYLRFS